MFTYKNFSVTSFSLIFCCFFLWACENDIKDIKAFTDKKASVEEGTNIESYLSQQAKVKARLTAPFMKRYQIDSPYVEFPRSLHVDFYDDTLRIESQLNAKYGRYKENERKVFLRDSVVVFNIRGDTLHCRELWWDQQTEKFHTDKPVRLLRKDNTVIYGLFGLEASQNLDDVVFFKSSGQMPVPEQALQ
ncbi:MAG: LPS export ABC transporter periplasmic protein LptC [Chitinophagaceae bacterium]